MSGNNSTTDLSVSESRAVVRTGTTTSAEMFYSVEGTLVIEGGGNGTVTHDIAQEWQRPIPADWRRINAEFVALVEGIDAARRKGFLKVEAITNSEKVMALVNGFASEDWDAECEERNIRALAMDVITQKEEVDELSIKLDSG